MGWLHDLEVEDVGVDPGEGGIVPVFGWGTIPDQYGRETEDDDVTAVDVVDLDADAPPGELDWDDEAELAAWDEARGDAWQVVEEAVAEVDRRVPDDELRRAVAALRDGAGTRRAGCCSTPPTWTPCPTTTRRCGPRWRRRSWSRRASPRSPPTWRRRGRRWSRRTGPGR